MQIGLDDADDAGRANLRVRISDSGVGISPARQDDIRQTIREAMTGTPQLFEGNGIGLAVCARLVHLMGGEMSVESEEWQGTAFSVALPVAVAAVASAAVEARPQELEGRTVLLADRHHASRDVFAGWLEEWGAAVTCADDDGTLGPLLKERRWGLVIIDRESLESVGAEVAAVARKGVPVIELTLSSESGATMQRGQLVKPLRRPTVAAAIAAVLAPSAADANPRSTTSTGPAAEAARPVRAPKVLVADDNLVHQRVVHQLLARRGCEVVQASTGIEALEAWHRERFDLVLMDVQMPEMDGLQAAAEIRAVEKRRRVRATTIVALTAHVMTGDRERCLTAGMDDYLAKPLRKVAFDELLDRLGIGAIARREPIDKLA